MAFYQHPTGLGHMPLNGESGQLLPAQFHKTFRPNAPADVAAPRQAAHVEHTLDGPGLAGAYGGGSSFEGAALGVCRR